MKRKELIFIQHLAEKKQFLFFPLANLCYNSKVQACFHLCIKRCFLLKVFTVPKPRSLISRCKMQLFTSSIVELWLNLKAIPEQSFFPLFFPPITSRTVSLNNGKNVSDSTTLEIW